MPTFRYAKLVRDNIRRMHEKNGDVVAGRILAKDEHASALVEKLNEEAAELLHAISGKNSSEIEGELADIYQVVEDLAKLLHANESNINNIKAKKLREKGGFLRGQYIDTVRIVHDDDPLIARFRAEPDKFLEN
jgi:predicted house-cleaning noncanonical NTP pyrophosphatase (MazG superfamily)